MGDQFTGSSPLSNEAADNGLFTRAYSLVNSSGVLQSSLGRRLFRSAYFLYKRYIEDDLYDLVRAHPALVRGGNVLDIGANIGYTSSVLAGAADLNRNVYASEPEPFNYALLRQVAEHCKFKGRIITQRCAVGAEDGAVDLWLNERHHADHRVVTEVFRSSSPQMSVTSVPMVSIDSFLELKPEPVSFVKIDVQGYELAVCQGMQRTIEKNSDITVALEYSPSSMRSLGFDPSDLTAFLVDRGFRAYIIGSGGKLSPGLPSGMADSRYVDLLFSRRRITGLPHDCDCG